MCYFDSGLLLLSRFLPRDVNPSEWLDRTNRCQARAIFLGLRVFLFDLTKLAIHGAAFVSKRFSARWAPRTPCWRFRSSTRFAPVCSRKELDGNTCSSCQVSVHRAEPALSKQIICAFHMHWKCVCVCPPLDKGLFTTTSFPPNLGRGAVILSAVTA